MDEEQLNAFIATLNPEQKQKYDALGGGKGGGKGEMEVGAGNMATIQGMPNIGNYPNQSSENINQGNQGSSGLNNTIENIQTGVAKYKEAGNQEVLGDLGMGQGESGVDGVEGVAETGVLGEAANEAMAFTGPIADMAGDNPVKQNSGNLFGEDDMPDIQSRMGIAGDSIKSGGETFAKTGNPYAAAFAVVATAAGGAATRESNMRLKTKIDAQTKFANAKADEHYSVYTDKDSVYYRGNKGYYGDSEGLA